MARKDNENQEAEDLVTLARRLREKKERECQQTDDLLDKVIKFMARYFLKSDIYRDENKN